MRIGFFTDMYLPKIDGVVFSIENFRIELEAMGHEVYVFAPGHGLRSKEKSDRIIRFPAVKGLFFDEYPTSVFFPPQAMAKIKSYKLDIIHFHTPGQIGLMGAYYAIRNKSPLVTTYHTDLYEYVTHYPNVLPGTIALSLLSPLFTQGGLSEFRIAISSIKPERNVDEWNKKIVMRGMTMLHNYCDRVIAPSRKIEKQLKSWGTKSGIRVLPTGVDRLPASARDIAAFKRKFKLSADDQVILFVGRLGSEKNIDLLIKAFGMLILQHPEAKLMIVGEHEYQKKLRSRVVDMDIEDRVIFTGYINHDKLGAAYDSSTLFAFPSGTDTQGLVLHEAASAGLPIVMIDADITEVVRDGKNGYIAKNNAKDFARKMSKILGDAGLRKEMSAAGKLLAIKYSTKQQAQKLVHLYENILDGHQKAKQPAKKRFRLPGNSA